MHPSTLVKAHQDRIPCVRVNVLLWPKKETKSDGRDAWCKDTYSLGTKAMLKPSKEQTEVSPDNRG